MRIVELLIEELEGLMPFDSVALVKDPAIQADFYAFNDKELLDKITMETIKHAFMEKFVDRLPGESKESYIGRCIPKLKSEGFPDDQAAAICYESLAVVEPNLNIFGYHTKHFAICPGAIETFKHLMSMDVDEDTKGMIRTAAVVSDSIFALEIDVLEDSHSTLHQYEQAILLADDFRDIMQEIDKASGMVHNIDWVDTHIQEIYKYLDPEVKETLDVDVSGLPSYVNVIKKDEFATDYIYDPTLGHGTLPMNSIYELQSYNDYPKAASENACKVLRWIDEHGRDEVAGMTQVGLARANQLCNKENISESTIARMAAFERHRRNATINPEYRGTPWKDKGYVAWLGWGGDQGVRWAQRKLEQIKREKERLSSRESFIAKLSTQQQDKIRETLSLQESSGNFKFSLEEEQQKVVGPLLIPNKLILRIDENGNPFYVYFSEDTVKQISERMLKDKRVDQVNLEHNSDQMVDGVMTETWIVEDPENDKSNIYGMKVPKGSWMGMYKINDPKVWAMVKEGIVKGFSLEGYFADKLVQS